MMLSFRMNSGVRSRAPVLRHVSKKGAQVPKPDRKALAKKPTAMSVTACRIKSKANMFNAWYVLRKLGVPSRAIVKVRRKLFVFNYPWMAYSIPAGLALGLGDLIGQYRDCKVKSINYEEVLKFAAIGFAIVGPILSKWNLFIYRRLACKGRPRYLASKIVVDQLFLAPLLLVIALLAYDYDCVLAKKGDIKDDIEKRYKSSFIEIMKFNIMTRPLFSLFFCYIAPVAFRRLFKVAYELYFCTYATTVIRNGLAIAPQCPPPPEKNPPAKGKKKK